MFSGLRWDHDLKIAGFGVGDPLPYAKFVLTKLKLLGPCHIRIFTGRVNPEAWGRRAAAIQKKRIADWLVQHGIPFDDISDRKHGRANVIIDDSAIQFAGSWADIEQDLVSRRRQFDALCNGR